MWLSAMLLAVCAPGSITSHTEVYSGPATAEPGNGADSHMEIDDNGNKGVVVVIGAGFAGLTAACELRQLGYQVEVWEKQASVGGRASVLHTPKGFTYDMGPSWYWMPGVFEHVFARYGRTVEEFYTLTRLEPAYRVELPEGLTVDMPGSSEGIVALAALRGGPDAALALRLFFSEAAEKFEQGVYDFIWRPMVSATELLDPVLARAALELDFFSGFANHLSGYTLGDKLLHTLLKWPVIFIGAAPAQAPSMYSLMTYAGHARGTWYPSGGMSAPAKALHSIATGLGVRFRFGAEVTQLNFEDETRPDLVTSLCAQSDCKRVQAVVAAADYHHIEQRLLPERLRRYDAAFWERQVLSPSTLLFYLGFDRSVPGLLHHVFYFDEDLDAHLAKVFASTPQEGRYAPQPTFYVCAASKTDRDTLPANGVGEAVFVLVPVHHRLNGSDTDVARESVLGLVLDRMQARATSHCSRGPETHTQGCSNAPVDLRAWLVEQHSYGPADFEADFNSFRGNAFGLANTLGQSLVLKPSIDSLADNLAFAGHMTNPGPGVPPSLVSGIVAATALHNKLTEAGTRELNDNHTMTSVAQRLSNLWAAPMGEWLCVLLLLWAVAAVVYKASERLAAWTFGCLFRDEGLWTQQEAVLRLRSYLLCLELLYRNGRTYFCASTLMHPRSLLDTAAMYALFRVADDFVDNDDTRIRAAELDARTGRLDPALFREGVRQRRAALDNFTQDFWKCFEAVQVGAERIGLAQAYAMHPALPAVLESTQRVGYGRPLFERFFKAMRADTTEHTPLSAAAVAQLPGRSSTAAPSAQHVYLGHVCRSTAELFAYMDGSAAVIGDFMVPLLIPVPRGATQQQARDVEEQRKRALPHARSLGQAFQLTNFTRDIHEDTALGRQYVPTDMCARHGIQGRVLGDSSSEKDGAISSSLSPPRRRVYVSPPLSFAAHAPVLGSESLYSHKGLVPLLEEIMLMAEELYVDADLGVAMLPVETRSVIAVARQAYSAIHTRIRGGHHRVYDTRFRVSIWEKLNAAKQVLRWSQVARIVCGEVVAAVCCAGLAAGSALVRATRRYTMPVLWLTLLLAVTAPELSADTSKLAVPLASGLWVRLVGVLSLDGWVAAGFLKMLEACSYSTFHLVFTIPVTAIVWCAVWARVRACESPKTMTPEEASPPIPTSAAVLYALCWTVALCGVATVYTLPWDDLLVRDGVWWYGPDRVWLDYLVGHTPLEEVFFFSIQTLLVGGLWCLWLVGGAKVLPSLHAPRNLPVPHAMSLLRGRRRGYVLLSCLQVLGAVLLLWQDGLLESHAVYAGLILSWCTPVLTIQWVFGAEMLLDNARPLIELLSFAAVGLVSVDRWAIRRGIWAIQADYTAPSWAAEAVLGPNMPFEEALFFLVSSSMCIGGLSLAVACTLDRRTNSSSLVAAMWAVHNWGTAEAIRRGAEARGTSDGRVWRVWGKSESVMSATPVPEEASFLSAVSRTLLAALRLGALLAAPLASVAHHPAAVAIALRHATSMSDGAIISAVRALQSARALGVVLTVPVLVHCVLTLHVPTSVLWLLRLLGANMLFGLCKPQLATSMACSAFAVFVGARALQTAPPNTPKHVT